MSRHLFIGGTNDGTRHEVEKGVDRWRLKYAGPLVTRDEPVPLVFAPADLYRRERFMVGRDPVADIFVHVDMSTGEMFAALMRGYRQGLPADPGEQYEEGFKRGTQHGIARAMNVLINDNPATPSPAWEVFRDHTLRLLSKLKVALQ